MKGDGKWENFPSHYHCVFFDSHRQPVTRAWVKSRFIVKFSKKPPSGACKNYTTRLNNAVQNLDKAAELGLVERRKKFCFLARFMGVWGSPWTEEEPEDEVEVARDELGRLSKEVPTSGEFVSLNPQPSTTAPSDCLKTNTKKKKRKQSARWIFSFINVIPLDHS